MAGTAADWRRGHGACVAEYAVFHCEVEISLIWIVDRGTGLTVCVWAGRVESGCCVLNDVIVVSIHSVRGVLAYCCFIFHIPPLCSFLLLLEMYRRMNPTLHR